MTPELAAQFAANIASTNIPITFDRHHGEDDVYRRGPMAYVIPGIYDRMPPELLAAFRARRQATITGHCPRCEALIDYTAGKMWHDRRCPISDMYLKPAHRAWIRQVGTFAKGKRMVEHPAPWFTDAAPL